MLTPSKNLHGLLLVDKERGSTSFQIVSQLRRLTKERTIGHAGTLDPFATGVMVMLIGREFTRRSDAFLSSDKSYRATLTLGVATDSYDLDGQVMAQSDFVPALGQVEEALSSFQGEIQQIPPMFSAKKIAGEKTLRPCPQRDHHRKTARQSPFGDPTCPLLLSPSRNHRRLQQRNLYPFLGPRYRPVPRLRSPPHRAYPLQVGLFYSR